jgi:predicted DNA binding protein
LLKTSDEQVYVLHLDRKRDNDKVENLQWATKSEQLEHSRKSPYVKIAKRKQLWRLAEYRVKRKREGIGNKLTSTQVMFLKKKLLDPNRKTRLKILAKQFGVTEMTLQRIKTGENWGHIKV